MKQFSEKLKTLPKVPGVYFFRNARGSVIYVGKAVILRNRVRQYFTKRADEHPKIAALREEVTDIAWIECASEVDALIEEARYIKKHRPKYNIILRDDKNYFFVCITAEKEYPRIFITHQPGNQKNGITCKEVIGPFTDGTALKETLKMLRNIYPYCTSRPAKRPCFHYHLGRCTGACAYPAARAQTRKNIRAIINILSGKRQTLLKKMERDMKAAAAHEQFTKADEIKKRIERLHAVFAHTTAIARFSEIRMPRAEQWDEVRRTLEEFLKKQHPIARVECYDISNISGKYAVGSMAVFENGVPAKSEYRKFKIKYSGSEPNDPKMIAEVLARRIRHTEWKTPDLIIVDGGATQLAAARAVLPETQSVISLAKQREEIYTPHSPLPTPAQMLGDATLFFLQSIRDEAHRFAVTYHRKVRSKEFLREK